MNPRHVSIVQFVPTHSPTEAVIAAFWSSTGGETWHANAKSRKGGRSPAAVPPSSVMNSRRLNRLNGIVSPHLVGAGEKRRRQLSADKRISAGCESPTFHVLLVFARIVRGSRGNPVTLRNFGLSFYRRGCRPYAGVLWRHRSPRSVFRKKAPLLQSACDELTDKAGK